jgi:hypothetical protein
VAGPVIKSGRINHLHVCRHFQFAPGGP